MERATKRDKACRIVSIPPTPWEMVLPLLRVNLPAARVIRLLHSLKKNDAGLIDQATRIPVEFRGQFTQSQFVLRSLFVVVQFRAKAAKANGGDQNPFAPFGANGGAAAGSFRKRAKVAPRSMPVFAAFA
jgi:hypothetical protein